MHRCITCPAISTAAQAALGDALFSTVIQKGGDCELFLQCLWPKPSIESCPSSDPLLQFVNMTANDKFEGGDGEVFTDGCCFHPTNPLLARAGFSAVQMRQDGSVHKAVYGCVPAAFPQTSLAGEYSALTVAYDLSRGIDVVVDCADLIRTFAMGIPRALRAAGPHACSWKFIARRNPDWGSCVHSVVKVKAHRALADVRDSPGEFARWLGNGEADRLAKLGAGLHEADPDEVDNFKAYKADLLTLANYMVNILYDHLNDPVGKRKRVAYLSLGARPILDKKRAGAHSFIWQGKMWICTCCLSQTSCPVSSSIARSKCNGVSAFDAVIKDPKGHRLWSACIHGGGVILYCDVCYAYCTTRPNKLKAECLGHGGPFSKAAKQYIMKNKHPTSKRLLLAKQPVKG